MKQVVTNLQQQLGTQQHELQQLQAVMDSQPASAAQRETALPAQLADSLDRCNRSAAEAEAGADDAYGTPGQHRAFIESRAFSELTIF